LRLILAEMIDRIELHWRAVDRPKQKRSVFERGVAYLKMDQQISRRPENYSSAKTGLPSLIRCGRPSRS
jgi:hypothetical protein